MEITVLEVTHIDYSILVDRRYLSELQGTLAPEHIALPVSSIYQLVFAAELSKAVSLTIFEAASIDISSLIDYFSSPLLENFA